MSFNSNVKKEQGVQNLKQAGRNFQDAAENKAEEVTNDLIDRATHAGQEVRRYVSQASDTLSRAGYEVEDAINAKPLQSTAIALCAGVILGMLLKR